MNRYIITKEELKGQEYYISALYDEKRHMIEVTPDPVEQQSILGNIYIARVDNIVKNLNAAFVKISPDQTCFLPLDDLKHPIFTKKLSVKKPLVEGDELLVQISREALKTKDPAVTTNLSFSGQYAVLTTGNQKYSVSSKLSGDLRKHYQELLREVVGGQHVDWASDTFALDDAPDNIQENSYGIIIRTNAAETSDEVILAEIRSLQEKMHALVISALHRNCYTCLYQEPTSYLRHVKDLRQNELEAILTDERTVFEEICECYGIPKEQLMTGGSVSVSVNEVVTEEGIKLQYYQDDMLSLSSLYGVKTNLEEALQTRVWLKSGAYLIIEPTEALTVIDVNSGKNIVKKDVQENFLKINKEAAVEIARQLRLRNISGMILIDFINLKSKEAEAELLHTLRMELKKDPIPTQLIDITKLGLAEVTRKKVQKSLREIIKYG